MMEPLPENDPLYQLLGKAKSVEPRRDFTRNVMRAIRQEESRRPWYQRLLQSLESLSLTKRWASVATCALVAGLSWSLFTTTPSHSPPVLAQLETSATVLPEDSLHEMTSVEEIPAESEWENLMELDHLLAVQDTGSLSDSQISLLLY